MSLNHPEPEVAQLARWAQDDDTIGLMLHRLLQHHHCANLTQLFEQQPDAVFELHEEAAMLLEQIPTEEPEITLDEMLRGLET